VTLPPAGAQISPDGFFWWDGGEWLPLEATNVCPSAGSVKLLGGSPDLEPGSDSSFYVRGPALELTGAKVAVRYPLGIVAVRIETPRSIETRPGLLSLNTGTGLKKEVHRQLLSLTAAVAGPPRVIQVKRQTIHEYSPAIAGVPGLSHELLFETPNAAKIADALQLRINALRPEGPLSPVRPNDPAAVGVSADIPEQIRQLAGLRDAGIISGTEFEAKKSELLARM
jgi:hypothetical protein